MTSRSVGDRIRDAREASRQTQRDLEATTGISQATLHRIERGTRTPKMNELLAISWAVGSTLPELTGRSPLRDRLECVARASDDVSMDRFQRELTYYLELDAYLDDRGISQPR